MHSNRMEIKGTFVKEEKHWLDRNGMHNVKPGMIMYLEKKDCYFEMEFRETFIILKGETKKGEKRALEIPKDSTIAEMKLKALELLR